VSPYLDKPLKSVTHDQCDARPTVTFPAAGHYRPLTGTKYHPITRVLEADVWSSCSRGRCPGGDYSGRVKCPDTYRRHPNVGYKSVPMQMMLLGDRGTCANNLPEITRLCVYRSDWNWKREKPSLYYCLRSERCFWVDTNGRDDLSFKMFLFDFTK